MKIEIVKNYDEACLNEEEQERAKEMWPNEDLHISLRAKDKNGKWYNAVKVINISDLKNGDEITFLCSDELKGLKISNKNMGD